MKNKIISLAIMTASLFTMTGCLDMEPVSSITDKNMRESEGQFTPIFMLQKRKGYARCTDVAEHLGVKKPSVSRAVKELSKMGYLMKEADGTLSLTEQGRKIAERIYEKHQFFTQQLIEAGVSPDIASRDACKLEHVISETSFKKLKGRIEH